MHPTAIIDPRARIHPSCKIGPYCVIGPEVELGEGCHLISHVAIEGPTKIGIDNGFFPFSSTGMAPQDLSYADEPTRLEIGDHNEIREYGITDPPEYPYSRNHGNITASTNVRASPRDKHGTIEP